MQHFASEVFLIRKWRPDAPGQSGNARFTSARAAHSLPSWSAEPGKKKNRFANFANRISEFEIREPETANHPMIR